MNENLKFAVRSSAHGSGFVSNNNPEKFVMSLEEALKDVDYWRRHADTVGGDAIIIREDGEIFKV